MIFQDTCILTHFSYFSFCFGYSFWCPNCPVLGQYGSTLGASLPFQHDQHSVFSDLVGYPSASSEFTPPDLESVVFLPRRRPSVLNAAPRPWAEVPEKLRCPGPFSLTRTLWTLGMTFSAAKCSFAVKYKLCSWHLFFFNWLGINWYSHDLFPLSLAHTSV